LLEKFDVRTQRKTEFVPITEKIQQIVKSNPIQSGICHIYVPHTTAGITINENADPMVSQDILLIVDEIIPFVDHRYQHMEDNSAAHVKACLFGSSESVIIEKGELVFGTWQGIFLCEFDGPRNRKIYAKILEG
jgi:secondary thiamine-phosphate synthase enzyme|tara:strand:+ start:97 stop:498 length:402 start_codon:yes stop_codon:yes gene_type:complete